MERRQSNFIQIKYRIEIQRLLEETENTVINQDSINNITNKISEMFNNSARISFGERNFANKQRPNKPWFGPKCRLNRFKTHQNKQLLKQSSKTYKKVMNQEINNHKFKQEDKLRKMQSHNSKDNWKYINSLNEKNIQTISQLLKIFFQLL